ncbi:lytic transglycosylase [Bacteroidia bacterium]|nr:lytic transglycosylase [Bacteroidia bacterium]GHT51149.1 lytic transglycosylase [Bacteroidia bacterium]
MNKGILSLLFLLSGTIGVLAQDTILAEDTTFVEDTLVVAANIDDDMLFIPESWDTDLDSLMNSWHVKYYVDKNSHPGYSNAVVAGDAVYAERLSKIDNIIELPYNEVVRRCIDLYVDRRRSIVEYMLGLESFYFPMIEQALDANDMPHELKYLTIVESALNPTAVSRAGATGLWQFMLGTGKQYNLEINSLVDERRDPLKATFAACAYLKDLYRIYGDWNLAIAAYNCGPGNVNKAIRRAKGATDYWKIYPYLPKETRLYVPLFIAANYVMNYYASHQLYPVQTNLPIATDTVMVNQSIHFDQIAEVLSMDKELLRALNPQYKRDIVPGNSQPRAIKLPVLQAYAFVEKEEVIANYRKDELFSNRMYVGDSKSTANLEKLTHQVRKGETIRSIESKYGVSAANIRKWNGLKSSKLVAGKRLTIYVDNGGYATAPVPAPTPKYTAASNDLQQESNTLASNTIASTEPVPSGPEVRTATEIAASYMARLNQTPTAQTTSQSNAEYGRYKVQSGDSFYSIAKKFPGYTQDDLMKINQMSSPKLKAGQLIKVPKV